MSFLLACLAVAASSTLSGAGESEFALVPRNAFVFVHLRPAELWSSDIADKLRKQYPLQAGGAIAKLGEDPADIESASLVFPTPASLQPFLPPGLLFLGDRASEPTFKSVRDTLSGPPEPIEKKEKPESAKPKEGPFTIAQGRMMMIVTTLKPYDRGKVTEMVLGKDAAPHPYQGKTYYTANPTSPRLRLDNALVFLNDRTYLFASPPEWVKAVLDQPEAPPTDGPLSPAVNLAGKKHHAVLGVNMTEPSVKEWKKHFLAEFARPYRMEPVWSLFPLLETSSATTAIDLGKSIRVQATFTFPDAGRALDAETAAQDLLVLIRIFGVGRAVQQWRNESEEASDPENLLFWIALARQAESALRGATVECRGTSLYLLAQRQLDVDALRAKARTEAKAFVIDEEARKAREISRQRRARQLSQNNLKQIILAIHMFHDTFRALPPAAICSKKNGKPLLSWRVAILPFIEENPLYAQFKLDEPWDSPHNIKLLPHMPKVFLPEGVKTKEPYTTYYQAFVGPDAVFRLTPKAENPFGAVGIRLNEITDGTSQTIGLVEAAEAVPWTKPADLGYDKTRPLPKVGGVLFKDGFHVAFMDGSVQFLSSRIDEATLRALITPSGGEVVDWEKFLQR